MVKHEILIESNELSEQFSEVITLINKARTNVIKVANTAMIDLYWQVGKLLHEKLANAEWGDSVVAQLADFIAKNAPDIKGFSDKNLWRMKQFFELTDDEMVKKVREAVAAVEGVDAEKERFVKLFVVARNLW